MTNLEKWRAYMDGFVSPDCYIDFGFYYIIASSLQRRVYCGPTHSPCYPNIYVILTGEPSVGKGLVVKQVAKVLKHHRMENPKALQSVSPSKEKEDIAHTTAATENFTRASEAEIGEKPEGKKTQPVEKPLVIPVAADATTYEALVRAMSRSFRIHVGPPKFDPEKNKNVPDIYGHSSLCFCLEEIASLFRKHTSDTVNFLLQTYDCGDYTYDTKTQGRDKILNCCLNFFGGTTPSFMQESFTDAIINEGFSSRAFFIFAAKNRDRPFWIPDLTAKQKEYYEDILAHVHKLTKLYGRATFTDEANALLEDWWNKTLQGMERPNVNIKLNPYYGRKKVHVLKLAMASHFGESTEMVIQKSSVEKVLALLAEEERKMHYCLGFDKANPLSKVSFQIQKFIQAHGKMFTTNEIKAEFWSALPGVTKEMRSDALEDILEYLVYTNQIISKIMPHEKTGTELLHYGAYKASNI